MARIGAARSAPLARLTALACLAALGLGATTAAAAPPQVKAPGSRDQHPLAVRLAEDGAVRACASDAPCKPEDEQRFAVDATAPKVPPKLEVLLLEGGRRVVEVRFGEGAAYFALLVAAAPRSEKAEARLLLSSWIGRPRGERGRERSGVLTRDDAPGGTRVTVGTWEEGVACGEPSILSRRRLEPSTLGWEELGAQGVARPTVTRTVTLFPKAAPGDALGPRLFRARSVSSAVGDPARAKQAALALTDGALDGAWVEGAPGPGTGELAVLRAPRPVLVTGIEIVPRATAEVPGASTVPASLTVVVGGEHHEAWLRDDPGGRPGGTRWVLELATPVTTDCVAVVLGKPALEGPAAAVALAEVRPTSALDAVASDGPALVAALALDEPLATLAATALETAGASAMPALGTAFDALPGSAQKRALDVVAALDCPTATEFRLGRIARARDGTVKTEPGALDPDDVAEHELAALRACVKAGDGSLATAIGALAGPLRAVAARELAVADPVPAVRAITDAFGSADEADRRTLRAALSKAAEMRRARPAFESLLEPGAFAARPVVTQIDVLRSLGERLTEYAAAPRALAALVAADGSFRTRYLALAPAAAL
ncbi:MAG: hypothetical protein HY908_17985, partial [Myxococcales bacterium]|nr:hypothetical protein [Myxococcales bacterium]